MKHEGPLDRTAQVGGQVAQRAGGVAPLPQRQETQLFDEPAGHPGMACAMRVPCGIAAQLVLEGVLDIAACTREICEPIRERLGR